MPVTIQEIRERLEKPKHRKAIRLAIDHERRVRFHTQTILNRLDASVSVTDFLRWVELKLPPDKFKIFVNTFKFPHESVVLTEEIFDVLDKIFDSQDSADNLQFQSREILQDANEWLEETNFKKNWRKRSMSAFKTRFNSIMVVDLAVEQTTDRPEPYYYFLNLERVIDFEEKDEDLEYLIFNIDEEQLAVIDDESYRVFQKVENSQTEIATEPLVESSHNLTYCPATFFVNDSVSSSEPYTKKSVLSSYLTHLDKYLYFLISKQILDDYAPYPLIWVYNEDCDYELETERGSISCRGGYLQNETGSYVLNQNGRGLGTTIQECPICQKSRLTGAGGLIKVDPPTETADGQDLRQPVGVVEMGVEQLNYNVEECERRKMAIFEGVTGNILDTSKEAINEKQVMSLFESRKAVLLKTKETFERAEKWVLQTMFRLRYDTLFVDCSISYGTEFFLFDAATLLEMYETARAAKTDGIILDYLQEQYFLTRFRNNREQLARVQILINLDPFRHLNIVEIQGMYQRQEIEYQDYILKINLSSLVARFERENIIITEFGESLDFSTRIDRIKKSLLAYIVKPTVEPPPQPTE